MKKIIKSIFIVIMILMLVSPICFAANKNNEIDLKKQVKKEDGSLFEKIQQQSDHKEKLSWDIFKFF